LGNISITGVGGKQAKIAAQGTVELSSTCKGQNYILHLENVLCIPGTRNNLISLGRWDATGGNYTGGNGAQGTKIDNHLYKLNIDSLKHCRKFMKRLIISLDHNLD
jgi:hypothetical protein